MAGFCAFDAPGRRTARDGLRRIAHGQRLLA
jgi:hypothetical protein